MEEKVTRANVETLQSLQRDINFLKKAAENNPSIEKTIETLRNSQTKLYEALAQHGITAEAVHKIIIENSDQAMIKEVMQLQKAKDTLKKQLAEPGLSPDQTKKLEHRLTKKTHQHTEKWQEIINHPDKDRIINKIEQSQLKALQKQQARTREPERTR